jgi:argininosuccinate synthase
MKSRGVYETPGGTILYAAHTALERLTIDKDTFHYKQLVSQKYGELVYDGLWFGNLRKALDAFVEATQGNVTGTVKLKLYKGNVTTASIDAEYPLFNESISSFGASDLYDQKDADGFIKIFGLPYKIRAAVDKKKGN